MYTRARARFGAGLGATLALAAGLTTGLAGCGGGTAGSSSSANGTSSAPSTTYPVTVGSVTLSKQPVKIVSLSPTATEMLFAIGAGAQVTAVDDQSSYPSQAPRTDLSGFKPNAEAVAAKSPDLVVLADDTDKIVAQLTTLKIPVYVAPAAKTLDDSYAQITGLGRLTGHDAGASEVNRKMRADIAATTGGLQQRSKKLTYYHELDPTYYSATSATFIGSIYSLVGLQDIADPADAAGTSGGYPQLSAEAIVKADPDLVFLADTKCCKQSADTVKARPGWSTITAVKNGQVVALDDDVASRWGPRIVDLLRTVAAAVAKVPAG